MSDQSPYPPYQPYGSAPGPTYTATNGLAIASLIVSCMGLVSTCIYGFGLLPGLAGAIMGHVARGQIRRTGEGGAGLALAGVIVGWIAVALVLLVVLFFVGVFVIAEANYDAANV